MGADPRFLGGAEGVVITDTNTCQLVVVIDADGVCDIRSKVSRADAARMLRYIADSFDEDPS